MSFVVITICSNRKRMTPAEGLRAANLDPGSTETVAAAWGQRLRLATAILEAHRLYGGRAFREAELTAKRLRAPLYVVSAGLGLVRADALVPGYALTLSRAHADGIIGKVDGDAAAWWSRMTAESPFHQGDFAPEGLILAALSGPYLEMIAAEWSSWPVAWRNRLRLFTKEAPRGRASALAANWMPYDDRLDAVADDLKGTQGDFSQRAMRHFADAIAPQSSNASDDAVRVRAALKGLLPRIVPNRRRLDDAELIALIDSEWVSVGGRSNAMLRRLRDDLLIACEQGRLKTLFRQVADARRNLL